VIEAAAQIVARDGIEGLSMRRLAEECGVSSMTPYRHVGSKEDLLRSLANRYLDEVDYPVAGSLSWNDYLREVFRSVRTVLLRHPELVEIAARHRVNGLAGYRGAELVLGELRRAGLDKADAVSAFTALSAFTIGFVQQEIPRAERTAQIAERLAVIAELPPEQFPNIRGSTDEFLYSNTEQHFDRGLEFILRGIGASVT
jgi:AcrR family transcriptional regulator